MGTYIIAAIVAAVLGFAAYIMYRDKKKGNGCAGCPNRGECGKKRD